MIELDVGAAYGKTLFQGLTKAERRPALYDFEKILPSLTKEPLYTLFASPIAECKKKQDFFKELFEGKIPPFLYRFLLLVMQKKRWKDVPEIARNFSKRVQEDEGELSATVITPLPLTEMHRDQLLDRLKKTFHKELVLDEIVEPAILGGAVLRVGNKLLDGSVRGKLNQIKDRLLEVKP